MIPTNSTQPAARPVRAILAIGVAGFVLAAAGVWWFLRDDAPAEVSLDTATESVEAADDDQATSATGGGDIDGTWTVDTETGEFDYESATGSFVGFRIEEELRNIGSTTAVGRTGDIDGAITIDGTTVVDAAFEIDLTTITTETSMRDDNVQDALETDSFPTGTFVLTEPIELGDGAADGQAQTTTGSGDFTIHGVTRPVTVDLEAQLVDGTVVVVGSTDIVFADYGVEVPSGGPVISVDDFGILELQLLLTRS